MKTLKLISFLIPMLLVGLVDTVQSQVFLYQGFETGLKPEGWTNEYVSGSILWRYRNGGLNPNDTNNTLPPEENDIARNPSSAYSGTYNAFFQTQGTNNEKTMLVSPAINLEDAVKPELNFWLAQMTWNYNDEPNWDILRVYYKTAFSEDWVLLTAFEDPIEAWTQVKINLPNPTSTYYIAFEGHSRWGFGVCIDEVFVEEKGVLPRYVTKINVDHPSLTFVPTGSNNVPILRVGVKVYGNTGDPILESLSVKSLNTADDDVKNEGVKLYYTTSQTFNQSTPLGSPADIVGGYANFEGINYSFPSGDSYIWVTYDVKDDATHGNYLDAMLEAESFLLNDTLYPPSSQSPPGRRTINQTVYFEDFEETHNWTLTGEFQVTEPLAIGGTPGNPNVANPFSGSKILGTDLDGETGIGSNPGKYEPNLTLETADKAISPTVDLFYYKNIKLLFQRHLNVDWQDKAAIEASKDGGTSWTTVWLNSNLIVEDVWSKLNYSIPSSLERTDNFRLRYRLGPTAPTGNYSGWNIDDVIITGEFIAKDASVTEWVGPVSGCGLTETEDVTIKVANLGGEDITGEFPVSYSLNGGITWVTANVTNPIPVGDTIEFTFPNTINLSTPGLRSDVRARTQLSGDQESGNNQLTTSFYVIPTYEPYYLTELEENDGYWRAFGANLWQYGTPAKDIINNASSGTKSWTTLLTQTYKQAITGSSENIFFDDFETDMGWAFVDEFERGNQEFPTYPYEGTYYIGTDLSAQGEKEYYYENGITPATAYTATSPPIDISNHNDVEVSFYRHLRIMQDDNAKFEFSPDNGDTWVTLWENNGVATLEDDYNLRSYSIPNDFANSTQMLFRFSITETSAEGDVELGWNIDNFKVTGKPVTPSIAYLESPCFDLSESVKPIFEAKLWIETEDDVDGLTLLYSIDGGEIWEHFNSTSAYNDYWNWYNDNVVSSLELDGWSGSTGGWITAKQLIPDELIGVSGVKFRFAFLSDKHNNDFDGVAIDDVKIYEAPYDLGVSQILNLASACEKSEEEEITVRIENIGIKNLPIGEKITVGIDIAYDGDYPGVNDNVEEEITLTEELLVGNTLDYTFTSKFNLSVPGDYTISAFTLGEVDPVFFGEVSNDTSSVEITVQKPYIELGPDIYTVLPDTVELVATSDLAGISYKWFDNRELEEPNLSESDIYAVPTVNGGQFWVELENDLSCVSVDSITVHRLIADVGVSWFESPNSACELSTETPFSVWVTNFGTDTLKSGYTITLDYQIDAEAKVEGINWEIDQTVLPGDSILYTFTSAERDMSAETTYERKAWATIENDNDDTNDLLDKTITVWGYPTFTFTDPNIIDGTITYSGISYTMDAGAGWESYLWENDSSTEQTFVMDTTGTVKVTVYDSNGCPDSDEVFIDLQFTSIGVGEVVSPLSDCEHSSTTTPIFNVQNLGTESVSAGVEVTYGYKLDGTLIESNTFQLLGTLAPNESFQTNFSNSVDISAVGDYTFEFFATYDGDPKEEDDLLIHNISTYGYPVVDLGGDIFTREMDYLLDADGTADAYLWSTDETTKTITVDTDGLYSVTATNGGMCSDDDEVNVTFLRHDYGVSSILNPVTSCSESELKTISVRFKNFGNDILETNSEVKFGYRINSKPAVEQTHTLTSDLEPGEHFDFSFTQKVDLSIANTYEITAYGIYNGDFDTSNDTIAKSFEIFELPLVYLGQDTVVRTGLITLDAGPGLTYLWNDASTEQTLDVTETGNYSVTVTNANGCQAYDEINIISLTPDYGVTSVNTPNSGCSLSSAESVTVTFMNHGTDTLYEDDTIELKLYLKGVHQATEEYIILEEFYPGDALDYTFTRKINLSTPDTYAIRAETYHVLDQNATNNGVTKSVEIWGNPTVTHDELDPNTFCLNNDPIELTGGNPTGGVYSGLGVVEDYFHPDIAGAGINVITYTYTEDVHGCTTSKSIAVNVLPLPEVTLEAFDAICENADPIELTNGSPEGGTYTGTGITDGTFYPTVAEGGLHSITYTYTDENGCTNSDSKNIEVYALTPVTFDELSTVCLVTEPFALMGGEPSGGVYSGDGVTDNIFDPSAAGVGTHTITYTYIDGNGCVNSATSDLTVSPLPEVTLGEFSDICIDAESLELSGGSPEGGTYSGIGVSDGFFDPAIADIGTHTITYEYTDEYGCSNTALSEITVVDLPTVTHSSFEPICFNADPLTLTGGSPMNGVYSGPGVIDGQFNPVHAGAGLHTIAYTYTDGNGCKNSTTADIEVFEPTTVTLSAIEPLCFNAEPFTLTGGSPEGGIYSGIGVSDGVFNPSLAGVGSHTITYTYTDINNCTYSASTTIEHYPDLEVDLGEDLITYDPVVLDAGAGFISYLWNDSSTEQTLTVTETGEYSVTVEDINGCEGYDEIHITLLVADYSVTGITAPTSGCELTSTEPISIDISNLGTDTLRVNDLLPITFKVMGQDVESRDYTLTERIEPGGKGSITLNAELDLSEVKSYELTANVSHPLDKNSDNNALTTTVEHYPNPEVDLGDDFVAYNPVTLDAGEGLASYLWQDGSTSQTLTAAETGTYSVTVTNQYGCEGYDEINLTFDYSSRIYVANIISPSAQACEDDELTVEITIENQRNQTIEAGTELTANYRLSDEETVSETITLDQALEHNQTINYTFAEKFDAEDGTHKLSTWIDFNERVGKKTELNLTINPTPDLDLGDDLDVTFPYTIESGISNVDYLWSTDETTSSITVDNPGEYWLTVTNDYGCEASDTITLTVTSVQVIPGTNTVVSVFPNPADQWISVSVEAEVRAKFIIELVSPSGQKVYSHTTEQNQSFTHRIDVTPFASGVYIIRVLSGDEWITVRLAIQR